MTNATEKQTKYLGYLMAECRRQFKGFPILEFGKLSNSEASTSIELLRGICGEGDVCKVCEKVIVLDGSGICNKCDKSDANADYKRKAQTEETENQEMTEKEAKDIQEDNQRKFVQECVAEITVPVRDAYDTAIIALSKLGSEIEKAQRSK